MALLPTSSSLAAAPLNLMPLQVVGSRALEGLCNWPICRGSGSGARYQIVLYTFCMPIRARPATRLPWLLSTPSDSNSPSIPYLWAPDPPGGSLRAPPVSQLSMPMKGQRLFPAATFCTLTQPYCASSVPCIEFNRRARCALAMSAKQTHLFNSCRARV